MYIDLTGSFRRSKLTPQEYIRRAGGGEAKRITTLQELSPALVAELSRFRFTYPTGDQAGKLKWHLFVVSSLLEYHRAFGDTPYTLTLKNKKVVEVAAHELVVGPLALAEIAWQRYQQKPVPSQGTKAYKAFRSVLRPITSAWKELEGVYFDARRVSSSDPRCSHIVALSARLLDHATNETYVQPLVLPLQVEKARTWIPDVPTMEVYDVQAASEIMQRPFLSELTAQGRLSKDCLTHSGPYVNPYHRNCGVVPFITFMSKRGVKRHLVELQAALEAHDIDSIIGEDHLLINTQSVFFTQLCMTKRILEQFTKNVVPEELQDALKPGMATMTMYATLDKTPAPALYSALRRAADQVHERNRGIVEAAVSAELDDAEEAVFQIARHAFFHRDMNHQQVRDLIETWMWAHDITLEPWQVRLRIRRAFRSAYKNKLKDAIRYHRMNEFQKWRLKFMAAKTVRWTDKETGFRHQAVRYTHRFLRTDEARALMHEAKEAVIL